MMNDSDRRVRADAATIGANIRPGTEHGQRTEAPERPSPAPTWGRAPGGAAGRQRRTDRLPSDRPFALTRTRPMAQTSAAQIPASADVVVIGGGPGGYVAAIRAAQLGLTTVCVEMDKTLGGTCVNVGCIPSKALLQSSEHYEFARLHAAEHGIKIGDIELDLATMMKRKDTVVGQNTKGLEFLFRKNKITWAKGRGTLKAGNVVDVAGDDGKTTTYQAKNVIIATGSVPVELPFLKFDEDRVLSNDGALRIPEVPKHLVVIGGGVIGLELGSVWRRLGAKVTV